MNYSTAGYEFRVTTAEVHIGNKGTKVALCHPLNLGGVTESVTHKGRVLQPWIKLNPNSNTFTTLPKDGELAELLNLAKPHVSNILLCTTPGSSHSKAELTYGESKTLNVVMLQAGVGGNDYSVEVVSDGDSKLFKVYEGSKLVETLKISTFSGITASNYVMVKAGDAGSLDDIEVIAKKALSGGVTSPLTVDEYSKYLTRISDHDNVYLVTPLSTSNDVDAVTITTATEMRDTSQIATVVTHGTTANSGLPYVTTVYNGMTLMTGEVLPNYKAKLIYACLAAGTLPNESLVNKSASTLFNAIGLDTYYSRTQIEKAKNSGLMVFELRDATTEEVRVGSDTSNFKITGSTHDMLLTNKATRTVDYISKYIGDDFKDYKKGKVQATIASALDYQGEIQVWFNEWQKQGIIRNFVKEDVSVVLTGYNTFTAKLAVQPIDVLEKLVVELTLVQEGGN